MAISNKKKAGGVALITVGSLALVGVGAGAAFTDTVTGNLHATTGFADLEVTESNGFTISEDGQTATATNQKLSSVAGDYYPGSFTVKNTGTVNLKPVATPKVEGDLAGKIHVETWLVVNNDQGVKGVLEPGETATVTVGYNTDAMTNADMGKAADISISVTGSDV